MNANQTPFRPAWWSFSLPGHRPCGSTYCQFSYESVPPIDPAAFQGDFRWLLPLNAALGDMGAVDDERAELQRHLPEIIAEVPISVEVTRSSNFSGILSALNRVASGVSIK